MASNTYGAIKLSTAEDVGAVLKKKTGSADGYKPKEWADTINLMGLLPIRAASGSIAHFTDGEDSVPLKSLTAQILPKQSGTGTPSPSNPRPISGTSVLNVTRAGANVWDEEVEEGYIYISGNALYYGSNASTFRSKNFISCVGGQNYYVVCAGYSSWRLFGVDANKENPSQLAAGLASKVVSIPSGISFLKFYVEEGGKEYDNDISINYPSTDTAYHAHNITTTPAPLARTIYGGSAEVVGGSGEETHGVVDLGSLTWTKQTMQNGSGFTAGIEDGNPIGNVNSSGALCENYPEDTSVQNAYYINDKTFKYGGTYFGRRNITILDSDLSNLSTTDFKTAMSGVKLCYPLETPSSFTFDGVRVESEEGVNNVWTDSGEVAVEYRADINLLISELGG